MNEITVWQDAYKPEIALEALEWLRNLKDWVATDKEPPAPELNVSFCKNYCPYFDPSGVIGCPSTAR